jgi:glycerophosphoryl diester phosphodiesterase
MGGLVIGHRGCSRYPENTLKALDFALSAGAGGVEVDVQSTVDGRLVLSHDEDLKRVASLDVNIRTLDSHAVQELRVKGEPLATLEEALELARSYGRVLDVDVKNPADFQSAGQAIAAFGYRDVIVSSFWHAGISGFKVGFPGIRTAYVYAHEPRDLAGYASEVDFLKPFHGYVTEAYGQYLPGPWSGPSTTRSERPVCSNWARRGSSLTSPTSSYPH